ncbi:DUF1439 domain-containing protein [Tolumonas lignilytica]|jgi:Protein of unknown function (DUF1439).|uniref:DUF1439 domain-containing protein n=1 Tax=Tolumonas lignilytica TaxID=1283284 RepID=UPI0004664B9E|nr:DUF1439 domain-containing protein [Tolumonas lignilytica]
MLHALLLTLSLSSQAGGPIDITEQELTRYVNQNAKYQQQYGLPGLFDVDVNIDSMQVLLGRQKAGMAQVQSNGHFTLSLPGKPAVDGTISADFEAKPRYQIQSGAVYLDNFTLTHYQIKPTEVQEEFAPLVGYLVQGLQSRLAQQPAYVLNTHDKDQRWLKQHVTRFELLPGKLRLHTDVHKTGAAQ